MKVRYIGEPMVSLTPGKVYDVLSIECGWIRIVDNTVEDYLFPPDSFEFIETNLFPQE